MDRSERCKIARVARELSQEQAAEHLGWSMQQLLASEDNDLELIEPYAKLAVLYQVNLDWLIFGRGIMTSDIFRDDQLMRIAQRWSKLPENMKAAIDSLCSSVT